LRVKQAFRGNDSHYWQLTAAWDDAVEALHNKGESQLPAKLHKRSQKQLTDDASETYRMGSTRKLPKALYHSHSGLSGTCKARLRQTKSLKAEDSQ